MEEIVDAMKASTAANQGFATELTSIHRQLDAWQTGVDRKLAGIVDRIEDIESRGSQPPAGPGHLSRVDRDHGDIFCKWLRRRDDPELKTKLLDFERKNIATTSGDTGGYAVPEEILRNIERHEKRFSPVRNLVRVQPVGTSDFKALLNLRGATAAWVGEAGTRNATLTPLLREIVPPNGELYAYPQCSQWSLDDMFFDVGAWLAEEAGQQFALAEGSAVISGDGSDKPWGMLKTTPETTADFASPLRTATAYMYLASDLTPGGSGILADVLIDTVYSLNSAYRANATWIMNSNTAAAIRKLKDGQDRYIWAESLVAGQPDRLLGYPVVFWEQMPDIGVNNFPVGFGDWSRAYILTDRHGVRIIRDEVTAVGFVKFYIRRRTGGKVWNNDAARFIRTV